MSVIFNDSMAVWIFGAFARQIRLRMKSEFNCPYLVLTEGGFFSEEAYERRRLGTESIKEFSSAR